MRIVSDLRAGFGDVRDQGTRPTCLAFASSDLNGHHHGLSISLSVEYLFNRAVGKMATPDPHIGVSLPAVAKALNMDGQPAESGWPYLPNLPADLTTWQPPNAIGDLWHSTLDFTTIDSGQITAVIVSGRSVLLALTLTRFFFQPSADGIVRVDESDVDTPHRHAVVAVAVGKTEDGNVYVLVRNSWGIHWGIDGYAWISLEYVEGRMLAAGTIVGDENSETN